MLRQFVRPLRFIKPLRLSHKHALRFSSSSKELMVVPQPPVSVSKSSTKTSLKMLAAAGGIGAFGLGYMLEKKKEEQKIQEEAIKQAQLQEQARAEEESKRIEAEPKKEQDKINDEAEKIRKKEQLLENFSRNIHYCKNNFELEAVFYRHDMNLLISNFTDLKKVFCYLFNYSKNGISVSRSKLSDKDQPYFIFALANFVKHYANSIYHLDILGEDLSIDGFNALVDIFVKEKKLTSLVSDYRDFKIFINGWRFKDYHQAFLKQAKTEQLDSFITSVSDLIAIQNTCQDELVKTFELFYNHLSANKLREICDNPIDFILFMHRLVPENQRSNVLARLGVEHIQSMKIYSLAPLQKDKVLSLIPKSYHKYCENPEPAQQNSKGFRI